MDPLRCPKARDQRGSAHGWVTFHDHCLPVWLAWSGESLSGDKQLEVYKKGLCVHFVKMTKVEERVNKQPAAVTINLGVGCVLNKQK